MKLASSRDKIKLKQLHFESFFSVAIIVFVAFKD